MASTNTLVSACAGRRRPAPICLHALVFALHATCALADGRRAIVSPLRPAALPLAAPLCKFHRSVVVRILAPYCFPLISVMITRGQHALDSLSLAYFKTLSQAWTPGLLRAAPPIGHQNHISICVRSANIESGECPPGDDCDLLAFSHNKHRTTSVGQTWKSS